MKTLLFVIFLILVSGYAFCIDVIDLEMTVELGIIPGGSIKAYDFSRSVNDKLSFYGDFNLEAKMFNDHFFFGIGTKIYLFKVLEGKSFKPNNIDFMFYGGLRINENVEIIFKHFCSHPIASWVDGNIGQNINQWYEEIGIKLTFNLFDE